MDVRQALLETLENLTRHDLKTFKWYLVQDVLEGFQPIPRSKLENADICDVVNEMDNRYRDGAVKITVKILRDIARNDLAETLTYFVGKTKDVEVPSETCDTKQDVVVNKVVKLLNEFEKPEDKSVIIDVVKKKLELDLNKISYYKMTSSPRGICLIINNEIFPSEDRPGSYADAVSLARVFNWLGFWVVIVEDQGAQKMRDTLKLFAGLNPNSLSELKNMKEWAGERKKFIDLDGIIQHGDAFVCCILSHGCSEGIYGSDDEVLPYKELLSFFKGSNCSALKDKPKLFFFEACRIETDKQKGKTIESTLEKSDKLSSDDSGRSANSQRKPNYDIHDDSDMLIAMSSTDKHKSYRKKKTGTWFIQSLCEQLTQGCTRGEDIVTILTDVGGEVSNKEDRTYHGMYGLQISKQMPEVTYRLRKRLVLPLPPLGH
ncbi:caspase-8-like [Osmerus mordax]|uniref:caspase-8-like n=1 Tax=Osmerus mordax TaxID=8014 RepID=UPI003510B0E4